MADVEGREKGCCGFKEERLSGEPSTGERSMYLWLLLIVLSPIFSLCILHIHK